MIIKIFLSIYVFRQKIKPNHISIRKHYIISEKYEIIICLFYKYCIEKNKFFIRMNYFNNKYNIPDYILDRIHQPNSSKCRLYTLLSNC
jgi:hypothetical protein